MFSFRDFILFNLIIISSILVFGRGLNDCDSGMCDTACKQVDLSGRCSDQGKCECYLNVTCAACDMACKALDLEGDCDDQGNCQCSFGAPEPCEGGPIECEEQCWADPRAVGCLWVQPLWCVDYGPFQFCGCECWTWKNGGGMRRLTQKKYKVWKHKNDV